MTLSRRAFLILAATPALAACASVSPAVMNTVGTRVDQGKVDFAFLLDMANRANDADKTEAEILALRPQTIKVGSIKSVGVRYFIERDDRRRTQHIAFPGSHNLKDWLEDFDIVLRLDTTDEVKFHRGFEEAAIASYAEIKPQLRPDYTTYVTGYSMGAAVAAIMTTYLVRDRFKVQRTVTFGQPRVTNAAGVKVLATLPLTRVVNHDDLVSMIPTFPFQHFGEEVQLYPGPQFVYLTPLDATLISVGEIWRETRDLLIADHYMDNYLERLAAKQKDAVAIAYITR